MKLLQIETKGHQQVAPRKLTVLVGPNNVGKSQTLRDIHARMTTAGIVNTTIVESITLERPATCDGLLGGLQFGLVENEMDRYRVRGIHSNLRQSEEAFFYMANLRDQFATATAMDFTYGNLGKFWVVYLDAASRLAVTGVGPSHNPHADPPQNLLQVLFEDTSNAEGTLRSAFDQAFSMDVKLDYSGMTRLCMRVARRFEEIPPDPRDAYPIMNRHKTLDEQGDGFRSFVGVVLSLLLAKGRIILLDEPEAFLHPAQARVLGRWVAEYAQLSDSQVIVSTHNANFLSGVLIGGHDVDIYRLNRVEDRTTFRRMSAESTAKLARSPLLSSQRVVESVFYRGVVVCEADSDRAFYQTAAARLSSGAELLFVNAHNKQTIKDFVALLTDCQIPVCGVTDIDILNSQEDLVNLLTSLRSTADLTDILARRERLARHIDARTDEDALQEMRGSLTQLLDQMSRGEHALSGARGALDRIRSAASKWGAIKHRGIDMLDDAERDGAGRLLSEAETLGLFIVEVGELEGWLDVGTKQKNKWIVAALDALQRGEPSERLDAFVGRILAYMRGEEASLVNSHPIAEQPSHDVSVAVS